MTDTTGTDTTGTDTTGLLVAFCGIDGSGKTTQLTRLATALEPRPVLLTRQPSDVYRGDAEVRRYLNQEVTDSEARELLPEMALFAAFDRLRHLRTLIRPALRQGQIVLSDRYVYSSYAYFFARGITDLDWLIALNREADQPDLVFYLHVDPELAVRRIIGRDGSSRKREELDIARMRRVSEVFCAQPWGASDAFRVLDGTRPADELSAQILAETLARLGEKSSQEKES
jgi:dTMP kinase